MSPNERFDAAAKILGNELSPESISIIRFSFQQHHSLHTVLRQVGFGIALRNLLAANGIFWEEAAVFDVWVNILMKSVDASTGAPPALTGRKE